MTQQPGDEKPWPAIETDSRQLFRAMNVTPNADVNVWRLAARALDVCKQRGWSLRWDARLAQMTCESAEFAEAVRGKRGDPVEEAGDMLFVLMSWTESAGIPFADVVAAAERKCLRLEIVPRYKGEEFITLKL
jgi:hypothetical protein